jgi:hypothetical protein
VKRLFSKSEPSPQFAPALECNFERPAVQIPNEPPLLQDGLEEGRAQRTSQVGVPFTPIDARTGKSAPQRARRIHFNAQGLKGGAANCGDFIVTFA